MKRRPNAVMSGENKNKHPPPASRAASYASQKSASRVAMIGIGVRSQSSVGSDMSDQDTGAVESVEEQEHGDGFNYAILIALYTLQGIPMGLSASIPFLIQQKVKLLASLTTSVVANAAEGAASVSASSVEAAVSAAQPSVAKMAYNAQAIFALCSWPFSLKLLWAPVVDSVFWKRFGRRKSWLVPVQSMAGIIMVAGSDYVEQQLGLGGLDQAEALGDVAVRAGATVKTAAAGFDVKGITAFFFLLYFLMATQDIAVDGWALTMLSKKNRGRVRHCFIYNIICNTSCTLNMHESI
jgi:PAT family acetyl-CoA transporter-like MFS transporter 1